jgi:hypothetical protein
VSLARPRFGVAGAALGAQLGGDAVSLGDDGAALGGGDGGAVDVFDHVGGAGPPAGDDAGEQGCGDVAERGVVVLAAGHHEPVVAGGEGRVGPAGGVGGHEQGLAERGVPGFGRRAVAAIHAGGGQGGDQAAEGPGAARDWNRAGSPRRARLLDLDRQIKDTTRLITGRFRTCPQAPIIESMPGMGPVLGAEFLVATGGNLAAFATSGRLAGYAGLVPVPQDSGRVTGNLRRPQRYNRRLRHVFYMAAFSSIKADGPSRTFYDRKRSERLTHTQALLALARRLVDVLWALLRDDRLFTPAPPSRAAQAA